MPLKSPECDTILNEQLEKSSLRHVMRRNVFIVMRRNATGDTPTNAVISSSRKCVYSAGRVQRNGAGSIASTSNSYCAVWACVSEASMVACTGNVWSNSSSPTSCRANYIFTFYLWVKTEKCAVHPLLIAANLREVFFSLATSYPYSQKVFKNR